ncbi:hypothetical protein LJR153_007173 [Paenibacillus sp. LjRoot153]|uniref:hypothetical protein n=1 Tax=Paenibacillus sp. LjRoot153 TaxID=3342270 RepID=UPI003ECF7592
MYINNSHRLLGAINDTRNKAIKEMDLLHAIPIDGIANRNLPIKSRLPVDHVTISQEALDSFKNLPLDQHIRTVALTDTDLGRFKEAFVDVDFNQIKFSESVYQDPLEKIDQLVELEARYRDNIKQFKSGDEQNDQLNKLNDLVSEIKNNIVNDLADEMGNFLKGSDFNIPKFKQHLESIYDSKREFFQNMTDTHEEDWNKYRVSGISASNINFFNEIVSHESTDVNTNPYKLDLLGEKDLSAVINIIRRTNDGIFSADETPAKPEDMFANELFFGASLGLTKAKAAMMINNVEISDSIRTAFTRSLDRVIVTKIDTIAKNSTAFGRGIDRSLIQNIVNNIGNIVNEPSEQFKGKLDHAFTEVERMYVKKSKELTANLFDIGYIRSNDSHFDENFEKALMLKTKTKISSWSEDWNHFIENLEPKDETKYQI